MQEAISIRPLGPQDASQFQSLQLAALRDAPRAFGSSYEEEHLVTPQEWACRLEPSPARAIFVAYGHEPAALRVAGRYLDETLMIRTL